MKHFLVLAVLGMGGLARAQESGAIVVVARPLPLDASHFEFPGQLQPAQARELRAPISGTVAKVLVQAGARVQAGDLLLEIDTSVLRKKLLQADAEVQRLETQYRQLEQTLELTRKAGKPPEDLARLAAERDLAGVRLKLAQGDADRLRKDLDLAQVKAPVAGRIDQLLVKPGQAVLAGARFATHLATLSTGDAVEVSFRIDERTLLTMREALRRENAQPADVRASLKLEGESNFSRLGQVVHAHHTVNPKVGVDPKVGEATCAAVIPDADGVLRQQLALPQSQRKRATVRIVIGPSHAVVQIVESAVITTVEGDKQVLRLVEGNRLDIRPVKLGPARNGLQTIEAGLKRDDLVVIGVPQPKQDPKHLLSAGDFARDLLLLRVRSGETVKPIEVEMPGPKR